ncbi:KilA-N domain-containing protein [Pseudoroseomonas globiformis]|uniref:KilA-N domain-containing protein n=1 Tax=Teichococcus globiformis TaxID=2307229 RepID=A0ABV7G6S1_9PROT
MAFTQTLDYQGHSIRRRGAMLNLTDMWKAAGFPSNRRPADWLALEDTQRFRRHADRHLPDRCGPATVDAPLTGIDLDTDGLVATVRSPADETWAHWHLALGYGRFLSTAFHLWCDTVVRTAMERSRRRLRPQRAAFESHLVQLLQALHRRFDVLDRHAADLMFLQLSAQDLLLGQRRSFSARSQATIVQAVRATPFAGHCPCCGQGPVLDEAGRPLAGAEFDHFFHRSLNRPENGWLICIACHGEMTGGGYLARFARVPQFRAFQAAVLAQRPQPQLRSRRAVPALPTARPYPRLH